MLPFSSERYEQLRDHSLLLRLVSLRDLGPYTCQAYNGLGKADSWTVDILTQGPVEGAGPGDDAYLQYVTIGGVPRITTTPTTTTTTERAPVYVPRPHSPDENEIEVPSYIGKA